MVTPVTSDCTTAACTLAVVKVAVVAAVAVPAAAPPAAPTIAVPAPAVSTVTTTATIKAPNPLKLVVFSSHSSLVSTAFTRFICS